VSVPHKGVSSRLGEVVGSSNVLTDPAQLVTYAVDSKEPAAAVRPGSSEEAVEIVKLAAAEKLAVIATGARTKLGIGLPPRQYDLALDMARLDRVVAYDPGDLTLSVEPGVSLRKLAGLLADQNQFLPLAAPYANRATVGGTIASGVDSPLRQFFGTARDFILGMGFITGEGVLARGGGRVVKNVAGYDLHKLMIGALGTLGIITRINLRTFPLPGASRAFLATFETAERALNLRHHVAQSPLTPMTLEILSPRVTDLFSSEAATQIEPASFFAGLLSNTGWTFTAGFAGNERVLDRSECDMRAMAKQSGAARVVVLGQDQIPGAFGRKREFVSIALASSPATTIVKIGVVPQQMKDVLAGAERIVESGALPWAALARGVGVIYFALLPNECNEDSRQRVVRAAKEIQASCAGIGAHATIPWCPPEWKNSLSIWGQDRGDMAQMRKLKTAFDPHGILSPGRFVGGI
jgi:glycolate oxidase FAD binding subunit